MGFNISDLGGLFYHLAPTLCLLRVKVRFVWRCRYYEMFPDKKLSSNQTGFRQYILLTLLRLGLKQRSKNIKLSDLPTSREDDTGPKSKYGLHSPQSLSFKCDY